MQNIVERLQAEEGGLPQKQRQLAWYMLQNSGDMCYLTLRQLAERAGVSEVTVLRLCRTLGLDGFNSLKEGFRAYQQSLQDSYRKATGSAAPRSIDPGDRTAMLAHCFETEMHNVGKFSKLFSPENYFPMARRIAQSRSVAVCGAEITYTLAQFLQQKLTFMGLSAFAPPVDRPPNSRLFCPASDLRTRCWPCLFPITVSSFPTSSALCASAARPCMALPTTRTVRSALCATNVCTARPARSWLLTR